MNYETLDDLDTLKDYLAQAIANQKTARYQIDYWTNRSNEEQEKIRQLKARIREVKTYDFIPY
ncbi:MAG: hypothetical protein GYA69_05220 [Candidatus Moranbacteria bacterium]|nr:hypothetical protein [Candidatus Moranbacteria bacterium]